MAIAQGIRKITVGKKQSGLGVPSSGSGGQTFRRETSSFMLGKDTYSNNEIASHQMSTGITHGLRKPTGKINGVLSPGTYSELFASLLRKAFATVTPITGASLTIGGTLGAYTVTRSAGSYLTDGVKIGDVIRLTVGALNASNINKNLVVNGLTATVATCATLNGSAMVLEGPIVGCTVTVQGKKCLAPLTGHTNDYWTFEEFYADIVQSELYSDMQVGKADIGLPGTGNVTAAFDMIGLKRTVGASQILTTPTAETTTPVLTAVNGVVLYNGSVTGVLTGGSISIDGSISQMAAVVGSNTAPDTQKGRIKVTGQITAYYENGVFPALFENGSLTSLVMVVAADSTATSSFVGFTISALKLSGDSPDDGEKGIMRTYSFEAEMNTAGGAALANDQTIISIQDSNA